MSSRVKKANARNEALYPGPGYMSVREEFMSADNQREKKRKASRPIKRGQDSAAKESQQEQQGQQQHSQYGKGSTE